MREAGGIGTERYTRPETSCITYVVTQSDSSARDLGGKREIEHSESGALHDHAESGANEPWPASHTPADHEQRQPYHHVAGVDTDVQPEEAIEAGRSGEIAERESVSPRKREHEIYGAPTDCLDPELLEQRRALTTEQEEHEQRTPDDHVRSAPDSQPQQMSTLSRQQRIRPHELHADTLTGGTSGRERWRGSCLKGGMCVQPDVSDAFDRWTTVADTVRATTKRLQKLAALAEYLPSLHDEGLAIAARFFSGIVFPRHDARTTQVGGSILWTALATLTRRSDDSLAEAYGRYGDAGDMVGDV